MPGGLRGPCAQVEKELSEICASILQLLDEHLIPTASSGESKVFYLKMKVWAQGRSERRPGRAKTPPPARLDSACCIASQRIAFVPALPRQQRAAWMCTLPLLVVVGPNVQSMTSARDQTLRRARRALTAGRLPPLPGGVQDRHGPQGGGGAHPAGVQGGAGVRELRDGGRAAGAAAAAA